jgi:hypothetical protein
MPAVLAQRVERLENRAASRIETVLRLIVLPYGMCRDDDTDGEMIPVAVHARPGFRMEVIDFGGFHQ